MISQVDPALVENSETDRLLAGVARLLFRHIAQADDHPAPLHPGPKVSAPIGRGCPALTADDFDEVLFLERKRCSWRCFRSRPDDSVCCFRRQRSLVDDIFSLLRKVAEISAFKKEVVVLGAIYLERLLTKHPLLRLTPWNWRPLLVASLHLASKTWEDVHAWNAEFSAFLRECAGVRYPARNLHLLELKFLVGLEYRMEVCGELYAAYYFALVEADAPFVPSEPGVAQDVNARSQSCDVVATPHLDHPRLQGSSDSTESLVNTSPSSACSSRDRPRCSSRDRQSILRTPQGVAGRWSSLKSVNSSTASMASGMPRTSLDSCVSVCNLASTFAGGGSNGTPEAKPFALTKAGRLDPSNPFVGHFRHAPRALPPSSYINRCCIQSSRRSPLRSRES